MPIKKATKTHTSSQKKRASVSSTTKQATKKAVAAKASKRTRKSTSKPKISKAEWRKLREDTLKMFQMVYDSIQISLRRIFDENRPAAVVTENWIDLKRFSVTATSRLLKLQSSSGNS